VVLTDLEAGGTQRVMTTLLARLPRARLELHLALLQDGGRFRSAVPADVPVHVLGRARVRDSVRPLLELVRTLRPDVVLSSVYHLNVALLLLRRRLPAGTRVLIREATMPRIALSTRRPRWLWSLFFRFAYRAADRVICQCEAMAEELESAFGLPRSRLAVVYNPIDAEGLRAQAGRGPSPFAARGLGPHVVAVGRLAPVKRFDRLVDALPALVREFPGAALWILGEDPTPGEARARALREQATALGVAEHLHLVGHQSDPARWLAHADLFVLCSSWEGLPNALLEALAVGAPVITLPVPGGTQEILRLAGLPERMVPALDWKREWFRGGREASSAPDLSVFGLDRVLGRWEALLTGPDRASDAGVDRPRAPRPGAPQA
jgi:glycosyltransferase involved in cell wall biosynthesis